MGERKQTEEMGRPHLRICAKDGYRLKMHQDADVECAEEVCLS
jgi:hypothetical protein